jgi:hypothetical protein
MGDQRNFHSALTLELKELDQIFSDVEKEQKSPKELTLRRGLNETWFSDTLAWLLDPKGSHGLGVQFLNGFVNKIGELRVQGSKKSDKSCGKDERCLPYDRRTSRLRFGKGGKGVVGSTLNLGNATSIREFFLTPTTSKRSGRGVRFADVVLLDLDSSDGLFLVIENKLFTTNHKNQLKEYFEAVEDKYSGAKVREYVYLTLLGHCPILFTEEDRKFCPHWIRMAWTEHVAAVLDKSIRNKGDASPDAKEFLHLLEWLKELTCHQKVVSHSTSFLNLLLNAAVDCLVEELNRIGQPGKDEWSIVSEGTSRVKLKHSSQPKRFLRVEMLPSYSIAIQGKGPKQAKFEKILIPFGAHPDQVFNLIDIAARDIYHRHFSDPSLYLGSSRRLRKSRTDQKNLYKQLFTFMAKRRYELQVLLTLSPFVWK